MIDLTDQTAPIPDDGASVVDRLLEETLGTLTEISGNGDLERALADFGERVRRLNPVQQQLARRGAIVGLEEMKVAGPTKLIDATMKPIVDRVNNDTKSGKRIVLADVEPAEDEVNGLTMLEEIIATINTYIAGPTEYALTTALWAIFAHAHEAFWISPILIFSSPEMRCGKTNNMILLQGLVTRPVMASNLTPAVLFRTIDKYEPCLLIDEADTFLRDKDNPLLGILNSGHSRASATVLRLAAEGDDYEPRAFSTWAPKAIAVIKNLPSTLEDRAVILRVRRRAPGR